MLSPIVIVHAKIRVVLPHDVHKEVAVHHLVKLGFLGNRLFCEERMLNYLLPYGIVRLLGERLVISGGVVPLRLQRIQAVAEDAHIPHDVRKDYLPTVDVPRSNRLHQSEVLFWMLSCWMLPSWNPSGVTARRNVSASIT